MKNIKPLLFISLLLPATSALANGGDTVSSASHPVAIMMLSVIAVLAVVTLFMGNLMISSYSIYKKRKKETTAVKASVFIFALLLAGGAAFAQEAAPAAVATSSEWVTGLDNTSFLFMASIIVLELIIIFYMVSVFRSFTKLKKAGLPATAQKKKWSWLEKLNKTKTVDAKSEEEFNLGHDYDGIEELDNPTPPWWQWGFVLSVVFAVVYLWVYFVSYSAPNQFQELEIANAKAEKRIQAYMSSSANKIDENTVTILTDSKDLDAGKKIFVANCAACHAPDGGGLVGPNLTDRYWLHGGSINDIFRTIKNGVPEKGMISWKNDLTPKEIAQTASFIHSLQGTKPANPKEPEGDLYEPVTE